MCRGATWDCRDEMFVPLPDCGISVKVNHFAFQTLSDSSGGVELMDRLPTRRMPNTLVVITRGWRLLVPALGLGCT